MQIEVEISGPAIPLSSLLPEIESIALRQDRSKDPLNSDCETVRILLSSSDPGTLNEKLRVVCDAVDRAESQFPGAAFDLRLRDLSKSEPPAGSEDFTKPFQPVPCIEIVPWNWADSDRGGRHTIRLGPHDAFGTGRHPSTILCLQFMEEILNRGPAAHFEALLDFGCGTGILAMAALKMGVGQVLGIEIDQQAIEAAKYNAEINGLSDRFSVQPDMADGKIHSFDLIVANLVPSVLSRAAPKIAGYLKPYGFMIISGFGTEQEEQMTSILENKRLVPSGSRFLNGWCALIFKKA